MNLVICDFFRLSFPGLGIGTIVALLVACFSEYSDDFTFLLCSSYLLVPLPSWLHNVQ